VDFCAAARLARGLLSKNTPEESVASETAMPASSNKPESPVRDDAKPADVSPRVSTSSRQQSVRQKQVNRAKQIAHVLRRALESR